MKESRSGIAPENLQEIIDAEDGNVGWTLQGGAAQYFTPDWLAETCTNRLVRALPYDLRRPDSVLDPQCGEGSLLHYAFGAAGLFGIDIDNRLSKVAHHITGHCVKVMEAFDDVYPGTRWDWILANPPFGKRWKLADGKVIDSTEFTWLWAINHANAGFFIANAATIEKLGIRTHDYVFDYWEPENVWPGVEIKIGIVFWCKRTADRTKATAFWELNERWKQIDKIVQVEKSDRPDFNIYLDPNGLLRTYLSLRSEIKLKLTAQDLAKLSKINKAHPLTLTTEKESRNLLKSLVDAGIYTIQPEARKAIESALAEVNKLATPLMNVTDFETVAYADEEDSLLCIADVRTKTMSFTSGRRYNLETGTYKFSRKFTRRKPHYCEKTGENYVVEHDCALYGQDRFIAIEDDMRRQIRFMDTPQKYGDVEESKLWQIFQKPVVNTVADVCPDIVKHFTEVLKGCEMTAGYEYYPGQRTFIPRVAVKDHALVASATGCHAKGQGILMYDGTIKKVEDVAIGDRVMSWNSEPRIVGALHRGREQMARIVPVKGEPFTVNMSHILTLVQTEGTHAAKYLQKSGNIVDVSVRDFLTWPDWVRRDFKLFRVPVEAWGFREIAISILGSHTQTLPIPPYFLGLLLGDGFLSAGAVSITKPDPEIRDEVMTEAKRNGWGIRVEPDSRSENNPTYHIKNSAELRRNLDKLGLLDSRSGTKFIPHDYKTSSWNQRRDLLAGLLDTDGHMTCGGYDFISKSKQLADDVAFVARSLGLAAYVKQCTKGCGSFTGTYHRVSISGDCTIIPCRIPRKRAPARMQKKNVLRTGFTVELLEEGDYYGFEVYGPDHHYLLDDFTVTHNTGKTLIALSLLACKGPDRCLIIAPQGCVRAEQSEDDEDGTEYQASQWITEINRFSPWMQIWQLFSMDDYHRICSLNGGQLPPGVYVTYYQAFFRNNAREIAPPTWNDDRLEKELNTLAGTHVKLEKPITNKKHWCDSLGREKEGIRCIVSPSMSTLIGTQFDMVLLDESHTCVNLDACVTQMLIRLQPKYRYAFTATPIPNIVSNLFSLMGWINVDDWYKGNRRNAAWPYARGDLNFFNGTFLCTERDFTQEEMNKEADPLWKGKCIKNSPVISAPARLLKLLKPSMAYASKKDMNPEYQDARLVDVRVEMGREQSRLYAYYLDRANIPAGHPLVRARKQIAWLRGICADPQGFRHVTREDLKVHSNMNPKVIATLELVRDILAKGEQVVIISSRVGLSDTIQEKLSNAGIPVARIDSTVPPDQHATQSNLFKARRVPVLIMGIKCAVAHSYPQCIYEIITSIEYSPGSLNQAKGRIDRVNSRPGVTVYCILHKFSIEELMHDICAIKDDAATICLLGKRIPREFKPVDPSEILAKAIEGFDLSGATPEPDCETRWPLLRDALKSALCHFVLSQK